MGKIVPCTCADWSGCGGHTPHSKQLLWLLQWRHSRFAWILLLDYWQVWQRTDLASCFAQGSVAIISACLAGLSKRVALSRWSFDDASLWPKASSCAHGPTVLTNPDFVVWISLRPRCAFIATGRIQDAYPCPHVMIRTIIRKWSSEKYFSLYIV